MDTGSKLMLMPRDLWCLSVGGWVRCMKASSKWNSDLGLPEGESSGSTDPLCGHFTGLRMCNWNVYIGSWQNFHFRSLA